MTKIKTLIGTFVAVGALVGWGAPTAAAAPPEPFTITETIDFNTGESTFTTTGDALCASGTFEDEVKTFGGHPETTEKGNLLIRTVYTCDDGSGSFYAQKHVFIALDDDGGSSNTGPITFHGGTGDYATLRGHGVNDGSTTPDGIGVGNISGVLTLG